MKKSFKSLLYECKEHKMNSQKFLQQAHGVLLAVVFLAGFAAPVAILAQSAELFTLLNSVQVTPDGNYLNADFVRIGYVTGRGRMVITFGTLLGQPEGDCSTVGYAWREYTTDMEPTGNQGLINCYATSDQGGLFVGDDFYFAMAKCLIPGNGDCDVDGWQLAKYDAVTWNELVNKIYSLASGETAADPTVAFVNGQIDISGGTKYTEGTHHNFFTTDLQFMSKRLLSDTPHIGFSSMIILGGITYFLSSRPETTEAPWAVIVMQYDPNWAYLGVKTLREGAATPQGLAFDGNRFYVAYTERTEDPQGSSFVENVHLAAFDTSWNLVDDIALTNFTLQDQTSSIHPWLVLKDNRLYVSYSQNAPAGGIETLQAYVKVYGLPINPTISSVTKLSSPFRLKITGTDFQSGCIVTIDGAQVPQTIFKDQGKVIAKKGASLKAMVPKGTEVCVVAANPDGGTSGCFSYTR